MTLFFNQLKVIYFPVNPKPTIGYCVQQKLMDKKFDETFPQMQYDIETPTSTRTPKESNTKAISKLQAKMSAIKSSLDCEISTLNDKHPLCKYISCT